MDWLITDYHFTPHRCLLFGKHLPGFFRIHIYQMCKREKLNYVAGAEIPKRYLLT
jgi:amidase